MENHAAAMGNRWLDGYGLGPYTITVNYPQTHIRVRYSNNGVRFGMEATALGPRLSQR
jgi:hypothetical protein